MNSPPRLPTALESLVLATVWKHQPITAYGVCKHLSQSILGNFPTSKGSIYPIIERLTARRLLKAEPVSRGEQPSKQLICTLKGEDALRSWVFQIETDALASAEGLRTRITYFECLRPRDRRKWIDKARQALTHELSVAKADAKDRANEDRFLDCAYDNLVQTLTMQLKWLGQVETKLGVT